MKFYQIIRFSFVILIFAAVCFAQSNSQKIISTKSRVIFNHNVNDNLERRIQAKLRAKGFKDIYVKRENGMIVLRGTVPKGKMAEAVQTAQEANGGKPVKIELTEK